MCSEMQRGRLSALLACSTLALFVSSANAQAIAMTAGRQPTAQSQTGNASTLATLDPVPANWGLIQHLVDRFTGPDAITKREAVEEGFAYATRLNVEPFGGTARLLNYTTYPSTTPGLENMTSVVYEVSVYYDTAKDVETNAVSAGILYGSAVNQSLQINEKFNTSIFFSRVHQQFLSTPAQIAAEDVVTAASTERLTAICRSRLRVTGQDLLPFATDKQTALELALFRVSGDAKIPIWSVNVSSFQPSATAASGSRKLLQEGGAIDTLDVEVWLQTPAAGFSPPALWQQLLANGALRDRTESYGLAMTAEYLNSTVLLVTHNETLAATFYDPSDSGPAGDSSGGGDGLSGGAIAGIVVGAVVGAALLIVAAVAALKLSRRRARKQEDKAAAAAKVDHSDSSSSELGKGMPCGPFVKRPRTPRSGTETPVQLPAVSGCPHLSAADIEICRDDSGQEIVLGSGAFAQVYKGRHQMRDVAVKRLRLEAGAESAVQREVRLAECVSHDANVVQFYGAVVTPGQDAALLVMELMEGGDLRAALDGPNSADFRWNAKGAQIAADVARGLAYMHSINVVHRDLKCSNVLLTAEGAAKIADVGSAALMSAEYVSAHFGTFAWAAPELLESNAQTQITQLSDCYSFGVLLWELVTGGCPVRSAMRPVRVPEECPKAVSQLITSCLAEVPRHRPTAEAICTKLRDITGAAEAGGVSSGGSGDGKQQPA